MWVRKDATKSIGGFQEPVSCEVRQGCIREAHLVGHYYADPYNSLAGKSLDAYGVYTFGGKKLKEFHQREQRLGTNVKCIPVR